MTDLLFQPVPQPRTLKHEPEAVYAAVLKLRRAGHRVTRAGRDTHMINGERVGTHSLLALAALVS